MNKKLPDAIIRSNQTILCGGLFDTPRLTPTGKISHAKTRVYTQRYRKEWEQMPDFREWLTSVPNEATRAYCTFCKKNLHAHRLSLLKHTCTMKHQRAALMYQTMMNAQQATAVKIAAMEAGYDDDEEADDGQERGADSEHMMVQKVNVRECSEGNEDFEYVVETLEMDDEDDAHEDDGDDDDDEDDIDDDDDENNVDHDGDDDDDEGNDEGNDDDSEDNDHKGTMGDFRCKQEQRGILDSHAENEDEEDMHSSQFDEDRGLMPANQKIKIEREAVVPRDTLAQAMAHVHGEFGDGTEESMNADMEMGVEDEMIHDTEHNKSSNSMEDDDFRLQNNNENENAKDFVDGERTSVDGDSCETGNEFQESPIERLHEIEKSGKNLKDVFNASSISAKLPFGNPVSISTGHTKTLKLNTGKTVTLRAGTQYMLSNLKTKGISGLLLNDRKRPNQSAGSTAKFLRQSTTSKSCSSKQNPCAVVAGTSQQSSSQQKTAVSSVASTKKPCISTHVLDLSKGLPIGGLQVSLYKLMDGRWTFLNESNTSSNGRCNDLVDSGKSNFTAGRYKIHFDVDKYFTLRRIETMYPFIEIVFDVKNPTGDYHIPVLLSPFGYTTYRGSSDR